MTATLCLIKVLLSRPMLMQRRQMKKRKVTAWELHAWGSSLRGWIVKKLYFYTHLGLTLMGVTVLIKVHHSHWWRNSVYILEKFYFEQLMNFSSSRKYSSNVCFVQGIIKGSCISIIIKSNLMIFWHLRWITRCKPYQDTDFVHFFHCDVFVKLIILSLCLGLDRRNR